MLTRTTVTVPLPSICCARNSSHRAPGQHGPVVITGGHRRKFAAALEKKPLWLGCTRVFHPDQCPFALQFFAAEGHVDFSRSPGRNSVASCDIIGAAVPKHDGPGAIVAFGNRPFESAIFNRMILDLDGQSS